MQPTWWKFTAVVLLLTWSAGEAAAQRPSAGNFGTRSRRPVTSPYLNLLRNAGGGGLAFDYYRRIRPELEFRRADAALNRSVNTLRSQAEQAAQQPGQLPGGGLGVTGHPVRFLDLGGYFSSTPGTGVTGGFGR